MSAEKNEKRKALMAIAIQSPFIAWLKLVRLSALRVSAV